MTASGISQTSPTGGIYQCARCGQSMYSGNLPHQCLAGSLPWPPAPAPTVHTHTYVTQLDPKVTALLERLVVALEKLTEGK